MTARHKINAGVVNGALLVSMLAGFATGSVAVFVLVLVVLLAGAYHSGELRMR